MTEEQQGGTEPQAEATSPAEPAEERVAAVAVADEPAMTETAETVTEPVTDEVVTATTEAPAATTEEPAEAAATASTSPEDGASAAAPEPDVAADAVDVPELESATAAEPIAAAEPVPASEPVAAAEPAESVSVAEAEPAAPAPSEPRRTYDGPEPTTMAELLAQEETEIRSFKHGDVVEGKVVRIDKDEILVDIGAKSEGVVSNRELFGRNAESQPQLAIGDTVLVYVLQPESPEGHAVLSLRRAGLERKWRAMQEQFEAGVIIEAPVIDHNKGGLIVDCGIRGFVPISQIVDFPRRPQNDQPRDAAQEIAEKLQPYVGRKLRLKILEVNRKANRLILSEKVALYEERREKRDELFSSLQVGQRVKGTVRSIAPFGVFIDLGGIDGLVHKSELSWNKVNNPEAGYKVGDEVEAEVIDINHERGRISLSIRRLQPDPWNSTVADFKVGDLIDGTVTKLVNFGAFVRVRDGLEGLIHISELSHQRVAHPGDVVHEGQQLRLKIISLESERHRLGLSLKQAEEPPARPAIEPGRPAPPRERRERRERPERSWSASDAVQEPEGGIDNTLAAAFAQVREQLAAAEAADTEPESMTGEPEATQAEAVAEAEPAVVETTEMTAEAATAEATEATAEAAVPDEPPTVEPVTAEATEATAEAAVTDEPPTAEAAVTDEPPTAEPAEATAEPAEATAEPAVTDEPPTAEPATAESEPEEAASKPTGKGKAKAAPIAEDATAKPAAEDEAPAEA